MKGRGELTNLDKVYWPKEGLTKGDLIHYYRVVSRFILPYLKNRPLVLKRFPNGIDGEVFFQKESTDKIPDFVETRRIEHTERTIRYFVVQNAKSLLYVANLGSIELHPFFSSKQLDRPDYVAFDLDPVEVPFSHVVKVALALHRILENLGLSHYCKTSGAKGLHIYVPLHARYTFEQVGRFATLLALITQEELPDLISLKRSPRNRRGKVYLDVLQNRAMQTMVAPYSVRGLPKAPVSTPLLWEEVTPKLDPTRFTITTVVERLEKYGDLFKPTLGRGIDMARCLKSLS